MCTAAKRANLALGGAILAFFTIINKAVANPTDCIRLLERLVERDALLPQERFPELAKLMPRFPVPEEEKSFFVGQIAFETEAQPTLHEIKQLENFATQNGLKILPEISIAGRTLAVFGDQKSLHRFLIADASVLEAMKIKIFLDPVAIPGFTEERIKNVVAVSVESFKWSSRGLGEILKEAYFEMAQDNKSVLLNARDTGFFAVLVPAALVEGHLKEPKRTATFTASKLDEQEEWKDFYSQIVHSEARGRILFPGEEKAYLVGMADFSRIQTYLNPTSLDLLRYLKLDSQFGKKLIPPEAFAETRPEILLPPEITTEDLATFRDPGAGSLREFAKRFRNFTKTNMAEAIFERLSQFIRKSYREDYLKQIQEIGFKPSTTMMALNSPGQKAAGQILRAMRILLRYYLLDHPGEDRLRMETIHQAGEISFFLDKLGVAEKVKDVAARNRETPLPTDSSSVAGKPVDYSGLNDLREEARHLYTDVEDLHLYLSKVVTNPEPRELALLDGVKQTLRRWDASEVFSEDFNSLRSSFSQAKLEYQKLIKKFTQKQGRLAAPLAFLTEDPSLLREGWLYFHEIEGTEDPIQVVFEADPIKGLTKKYAHIMPKFIKGLQKGIVPPVGTDGIRILSSIPSGTKGSLFEVKIMGKGNYRLIGCFKAGIFHVLRFDPDAPDTRQGWDKRYAGLCR